MKNLLSLAILVRTAVLFLLLTGFAVAQPPSTAAPAPVRALIVVAHPDDEACFAATVYEITHNLGGVVDQLVITNGEGGYRYSLLAEPYGIALTDEAMGRAALPEIRKRELLEAGKILGVANHFFWTSATFVTRRTLTRFWANTGGREWCCPRWSAASRKATTILYSRFFLRRTHGGHKAATMTALNAVEQTAGAAGPCACLQDSAVWIRRSFPGRASSAHSILSAWSPRCLPPTGR